MMAMAQVTQQDDLFFATDPEGWGQYESSMQNQVGMLIPNWNGLRIIK